MKSPRNYSATSFFDFRAMVVGAGCVVTDEELEKGSLFLTRARFEKGRQFPHAEQIFFDKKAKPMTQTKAYPAWLYHFVRESNTIENIHDEPSDAEMAAHQQIMELSAVTIPDLEAFVSACAPGNILRIKPNLNVRVGNHIAPQGGPNIAAMLDGILAEIKIVHPYATHHRYETLHPFTDGNGRSWRALWMWQHFNSPSGKPQRVKQLGFLHAWYYESLEFGR